MEDHVYPEFLSGFVYVMRGKKGRYKIGHSVNPRKRRSSLSSLVYPVEIILLIETHNMIAIELELHMRFKAKRHLQTEWYHLDKADIALIVREYGGERYVPGVNPNVP